VVHGANLSVSDSGALSHDSKELAEWLAERSGAWRVAMAGDRVLVLHRTGEVGPPAVEPQSSLALCGELGTQSDLSDVLNMLSAGRWTGSLVVTSEGIRRAVELLRGDVVSAFSTSPAERLGELLCRHGMISRPELEEALAVDATRLGATLVERKVITSHDLYSFLRRQTEEIFYALLLIAKGEVQFFRRDPEAEAAGSPFRISTHNLLLRGVQRVDEMRYFRQKIPHGDAIYARTEAKIGEVSLDVEEERVLELCDGRRSLLEIAVESRLSEFDATKAVYRLLQSGLLRARSLETLPPRSGITKTEPTPTQTIDSFNEVYALIFEHAGAEALRDELKGACRDFVETTRGSPSFLGDIALGEGGTLAPEALLDGFDASDPEAPRRLTRGLGELLELLVFVATERLEGPSGMELRQSLEALLQRRS